MTWRARAVCAQVDSKLFFPSIGESARPAKSVCAACPVRAECLEEALSSPFVVSGVWGGTSENERREMRRVGAS